MLRNCKWGKCGRTQLKVKARSHSSLCTRGPSDRGVRGTQQENASVTRNRARGSGTALLTGLREAQRLFKKKKLNPSSEDPGRFVSARVHLT